MPSLAEWVRAVKENPYAARIFGPPSALVTEKAGGKKEKMVEAAEKLRKEYGLDEPVPLREKGPHPAEHVEGQCGYCANNVTSNNVTDSEDNSVTRRGRPKKYESDAERQAAYRERTV